MKTSFRIALGIFCLCLSSLPARASGTSGAAFLDIPVGAGPASQGSAYTALASDAYAPVWNPAGLGMLASPQLAGEHLSYLESIHYEHVSYVHPLPKGHGLGISARYLGSGDITERNPSGDETGSYSSHYGAYALSYGKRFGDRLAVGLTGKFIQAKLADVSGSAFAGDAGMLFALARNVRLGATLVNVGSKLEFINDADTLPLGAHAGLAWEIARAWRVSPEVVWTRDADVSFRVGAQWQPVDMLALRVGYRTDTLDELSALAGFSTGLGLNFWGQEFAYAWVPYGDLGNTNYFSLVFRFGSQEQRQNLIQYRNIKKQQTVQAPGNADEAASEDIQLMQILEKDESDKVGKK